MSYTEAVEFLYALRLFGCKLGLENTRKLAGLAGNPQDKLRFIHVAGTNGKGSTCAMLESIYRAGGLRVGLFTSPHLVSFRERIQVNRELVSESDVVRLVIEMKGLMERTWDKSDLSHPTFFEVVTLMALRYFAEQGCEIVIWETGLGGRLDATNIVTPLASVITNIQFDHQQWLGHTRAEIASEKAGIIKPGVPVITATDEPEALEVIAKAAREIKSPLTVLQRPKPDPAGIETRLLDSLALPLLGEHQKQNAALAIATVNALQDKMPIADKAIRTGLEQVHWPGRLQWVTRDSGRTILLDGAHNAAGAGALRAALRSEKLQAAIPAGRSAMENGTLIFGVLEDKDWKNICDVLAPLGKRVFLVPVQNERTASPETLLAACRSANPAAEVTACPSLADALKLSANDPFVLITGSLYLVGEAMELLELTPTRESGERGLNEWSGKK